MEIGRSDADQIEGNPAGEQLRLTAQLSITTQQSETDEHNAVVRITRTMPRSKSFHRTNFGLEREGKAMLQEM